MNLLQAQLYGDYPPVPYPTPPQDRSPYATLPPDSPVLTPTEESGTPRPTVDTETQLKFPTQVTDFSGADRYPDIYWQKLMSKLPSYVERWDRDLKFDDYIKLRMEEAGPPCLGCYRFWAVMCELHENAKQQSGGSGVIRTAYCLMRENNCEKMCNVMRLVLLEFY